MKKVSQITPLPPNPNPNPKILLHSLNTSMELEARFKVRRFEGFGKVFGGTEAIRLLLRFKIDSFGSRLNWTRLKRRKTIIMMMIKVIKEELPE